MKEIPLIHELLLILCSMLLGTSAGLVYDVLRPVRYGKGKAAEIITDMIFSILALLGIIAFAMKTLGSRSRMWELTAAIGGFIIYINSLSRLFLPLILKVNGIINKFFEKNKEFIKKIKEYRKNLFKKNQI